MNGTDYRQVVVTQKDRVHTYAVWMLQDLEEARDVTQEVLTRLWERRDCVRNGAAKTWLLRTAHRLCVDRLRRRTNRREVGLEQLAPAAMDCDPGPVSEASATELRGLIGDALATLSARDRAVLLMREVDGMTYNEMSNVLDVPPGALKVALHRARERLRRQLVGVGVRP